MILTWNQSKDWLIQLYFSWVNNSQNETHMNQIWSAVCWNHVGPNSSISSFRNVVLTILMAVEIILSVKSRPDTRLLNNKNKLY